MAAVNVFDPDALEANRRGELTDSQRRGFGAQASSNHRSALSMAAVFVAGEILVGFFASPSAPLVSRAVITLVCLLVSFFLLLQVIVGFDALTRDVRAGRVQSIEGAIGKRGSLTTGRGARQDQASRGRQSDVQGDAGDIYGGAGRGLCPPLLPAAQPQDREP